MKQILKLLNPKEMKCYIIVITNNIILTYINIEGVRAIIFKIK